ncbi:MAG: hypothetical protein FWC32_09980 [Firmicutes bacterium]|nr:hypothetical protein [Bacillota bacterium]
MPYTFKGVADFWLYNVCDVSSKSEEFIRQNEKNSDELLAGLRYYSEMLRNICKSTTVFEVSTKERKQMPSGIYTDDLDNCHNLTFTRECLLILVRAGELQKDGGAYFLTIGKDKFKEAWWYSVPPKAAYFGFLQQVGFHFRFLKKGSEVAKYATCDTIELYSDDYNAAFYALKFLYDYWAEHKQVKYAGDGYGYLGDCLVLADYDSILFQSKVPKRASLTLISSIVELPQSVFNCAGDRKDVLTQLLVGIFNQPNLSVKINFDLWLWWMKVSHKNKKTKNFTFVHVEPNYVWVYQSLPIEVAKQLVDTDDELSGKFCDKLKMGCTAGCGKCATPADRVEYKGYRFCKHESINIDINAQDDIDFLCKIIEMCAKS